MSYDTIEAGVLTLVQALSNYSTTNSSRRDHRILAKGLTGGRAVILMPGPVLAREVVASPRRVRSVWLVNLDLYRLYGPRNVLKASIDNLQTDTQELLDHLDKYPTLNGVSGVIHAMVTGVGELNLFVGENGQWLTRRLSVEVEERTAITIAE